MIAPTEIRKRKEGKGLKLTWADGRVSEYAPLSLRSNCHCAACRDEITGSSRLDPAKLDPDLTIQKIELVGNYAVGISFSDGHGSGIYAFDHLRKISP